MKRKGNTSDSGNHDEIQGDRGATDTHPAPHLEIEERPMRPLFGSVLDSYELVELPMEPHASNRIAQLGQYWLKVTHCSSRKIERAYLTRIRLEVLNEALDPPFKAVYELDRKLTYQQLCEEFAKLQVILHHPDALQEACQSAIRPVYYANCLPEDAPPWMGGSIKQI